MPEVEESELDQQKAVVPEDEGNLVDEAEADDTVLPHHYGITSFGADYDVEGLVRRLRRGEIFIPTFQREYVWSQSEASRFIESLLLGLPVPGVILATDPDTNKLLVIDGQQRLKTIQFFYEGNFDPQTDERARRVFKLVHVQPRYEGKTYQELEESDRIHLDNSIIHATIVKQDFPEHDDTSVFHIFERLNTGGRRLFPHEIRVAIYYGSLIDCLRQWNDFPPWRNIFGRKNKRLKDQELILRFLALHSDGANYSRPMSEFLNRFVMRNRNPSAAVLGQFEKAFKDTISAIGDAVGERAFRLQYAINAALFDSVMVAVARRLQAGAIENRQALRDAYQTLLANEAFRNAISGSTSDERSVATRLALAGKIIGAV